MIKFENKELDLGIVYKKNLPFHEILEIHYLYENDSPYKYNISNINTGCSCTASDYKKNIDAFEKNKIVLKFNTKGYIGNIKKHATVFIQDQNGKLEQYNISFTLNLE